MNAAGIAGIIITIGLVGWIPIWFFFNGIVKVIRAIKGLDNDGMNLNIRDFSTEEDEE